MPPTMAGESAQTGSGLIVAGTLRRAVRWSELTMIPGELTFAGCALKA